MPQKSPSAITPDQLAALRHALGLTQIEFATRLGIGKMLIYKLETGQAPITLATAMAAAALALAHHAPATAARIPNPWGTLLTTAATPPHRDHDLQKPRQRLRKL